MTRQLLDELKQTRPYASLTEEAQVSLARTAAVMSHAFEEALKPFDITATQYNVLRILRGAGPDGLCRNEIRDRMVTQVPDVTRLLDRLESMGLITRARGVADRRQMTTRITPAGLKMLDRLDEPVLACHKHLLGHLSASELRALLGLLDKVRAPHASEGR